MLQAWVLGVTSLAGLLQTIPQMKVLRTGKGVKFKGDLSCKNHFYKVFEHSCVAVVCENNQSIMVKKSTHSFFYNINKTYWDWIVVVAGMAAASALEAPPSPEKGAGVTNLFAFKGTNKQKKWCVFGSYLKSGDFNKL